MADWGNEDRNPQPKAVNQGAKLMNKDQWQRIEKVFGSVAKIHEHVRKFVRTKILTRSNLIVMNSDYTKILTRSSERRMLRALEPPIGV
jgi:hypothetical protein